MSETDCDWVFIKLQCVRLMEGLHVGDLCLHAFHCSHSPTAPTARPQKRPISCLIDPPCAYHTQNPGTHQHPARPESWTLARRPTVRFSPQSHTL